MGETRGNETILIVDGSEDRRLRNAALLKQAGFSVMTTPTVDSALRMFREFGPAIALVGDSPPASRAVDLCSVLRSLPDGTTLPIVLLTREEDPAVRAIAFAGGTDDVIADGVPAEELLLRIARLLDRKRRSAQAAEHDRLDAALRVAHTIRHGINNPLQVLEFGLELLRDKVENDSESLELLQKMTANVGRVRDLMERLSRLTELKEDPVLTDPHILDVFDPNAKHVKRLRERGAYRVLVVEDDAGQRLVATSVLARSGRFLAQEAASGEEALEMARRDPPDVMLMDINMPGLNGFELCAHVKRDPELAHTVVVMLTVRQSLRDLLRCHELGAENYLLKPIDPSRLVEQIFRTMTNRGYAQLAKS